MAALADRNLTLADWASRKDPDGKMMVITELLNLNDRLLDDIVWREANGVQKHIGSVRTGLPDVYFRVLNQGVPVSKSTTAKVEEVMSAIESRSDIDVRLIKLNGSDPNFRASEDLAFIEAMRQKMLYNMIYGNPKKDPENFIGLHLRYNDPKARNHVMVIDADKTAKTGSNYASIYLPIWGDQTVHGLFPKGSSVGLQHQNLGENDALDANGNKFRAVSSLFSWEAGLHVVDWESCGRIANISLAKLESGDINLIHLLIDLTERIEKQSMGKPVIYCPRSVRTYLRKQVLAKNNVNLTWDTAAGKRVLAFDGIEIQPLKALEFNEPAYDPTKVAA